MKVIEYIGLDTSGVSASYKKVKAAIERDDFRSADVKKLQSMGHGKFYRARLDHTNRLLFSLVRHGDAVYALMLEVIANHAYDKSRFLRGARVDETKIPAVDAAEAGKEADPVRYVHPSRAEIHLLDKPISFDDAQEAIYRLPPPVIIVGSAGSGKTALTLERMKHAEGEVLYVTQSAYLARSARDLYYAHGFDREGQEASFLSYRELIETIRVPAGREATWRDFSAYFGRMKQRFKGLDAHQAYEEIRGVITADAGGPLDRETYLGLGVRQSIFPPERRESLYDLFEHYRGWLTEAGLYDLNMIAHAWREEAKPRYDFVVVDEVQDLTIVQLALVLASLKKAGHFLLCGDSNQIVHPNFFSWSQVKSLFWKDPKLAERQSLQVLRANYRNGGEATRVANALLKIKVKRFGSIDRESNYLVEPVSAEPGSVTVLPDKDAVKRDLDERTRASTRFAVLVMRDEEKAQASKHFRTPLIFSIHEAKGLEYENIVLYRFISNHRAEYGEIIEGVEASDLETDALEYRRASDKTDKSLEVYKFYVNALYVALTRAIKNIYIVESDVAHPLLRLLDVGVGAGKVEGAAKASTIDEWQKEARKLELQGKQEQADAIRKTILRQTPVPWPVYDEAKAREALGKVFAEQAPSPKYRHQLFDYAAVYDMTTLALLLAHYGKYEQAKDYEAQFPILRRKHFGRYGMSTFKEVLKECDRHGVDHRTPMNLTPLIMAASEGNLRLVDELLDRGADLEATDPFGCNALHWAMARAYDDPEYGEERFPELYERLAPPSVDVKVGDRLVRIDRHLSEYVLFQTMWALFRRRFSEGRYREIAAFSAPVMMDAYDAFPYSVLTEQRRKRQFISAVLARNEVHRDYAYNRHLFLRLDTGWYQFNPEMSVRVREGGNDTWKPVMQALNLPLIKEFCEPRNWHTLDHLLALGGHPPAGTPAAGALFLAAQSKKRR
ncbi:MAG: AAA family ATPase [Candidatus Sericytochromatia bacterium]